MVEQTERLNTPCNEAAAASVERRQWGALMGRLLNETTLSHYRLTIHHRAHKRSPLDIGLLLYQYILHTSPPPTLHPTLI